MRLVNSSKHHEFMDYGHIYYGHTQEMYSNSTKPYTKAQNRQSNRIQRMYATKLN